MASRVDLHNELKRILGSNYVYHQPPESIKMVYPCIRYELSNIQTKYADNIKFSSRRCYKMILIDKNPDSAFVDALMTLPLCDFDRHYCVDNLHHWVFTLYF